MAARGRVAGREEKESVNGAQDGAVEAGLRRERKALELLVANSDRKEGMRALLEKRKPKFEGK